MQIKLFTLFSAGLILIASSVQAIALPKEHNTQSTSELLAAQTETETMAGRETKCGFYDDARKEGTRMHVIKAPRNEVITHSIKKDGDHVKVQKK